jgi:hypothetical protein
MHWNHDGAVLRLLKDKSDVEGLLVAMTGSSSNGLWVMTMSRPACALGLSTKMKTSISVKRESIIQQNRHSAYHLLLFLLLKTSSTPS